MSGSLSEKEKVLQKRRRIYRDLNQRMKTLLPGYMVLSEEVFHPGVLWISREETLTQNNDMVYLAALSYTLLPNLSVRLSVTIYFDLASDYVRRHLFPVKDFCSVIFAWKEFEEYDGNNIITAPYTFTFTASSDQVVGLVEKMLQRLKEANTA